MEHVRRLREAGPLEPQCPVHSATHGRTRKCHGVGTTLKALLPPSCLKWQDELDEKACLDAVRGAATLMIFLCQRNWGENTLEPGQLSSAFM